MITTDYFLSIYQEFSELESAKISLEISVANNLVLADEPEIVWGSNFSYSVATLTAHLCAIQHREQLTIGGALVAIDLGKVPEFSSDSDKYLELTNYGKLYKHLLSQVRGELRRRVPGMTVI